MEAKELLEQIGGVKDELTAALGTMQDEIKSTGETSKETADKISMLTKDYVGLNETFTEAQTKHDAVVGELTGRIDELEAKLQRGDISGSDGDELKSLGELFVASDEVQQMITRKEYKCAPVLVKSLFPELREQKGTLLSTPPSRLVMPQRADFVGATERQLRIRDLIPVRSTTSNAIEYIREVGFNADATVSVTTAAISSTVVTITATAHGMRYGERVRIAGITDETAANGDFWITSVADADTFTYVAPGAGDTVGATGTITALGMQRHGAAAETAEGVAKPEASLYLELLTEAVQAIPHWIPASRQVLADAGQLEAYVNDRLRYGVMYKEDVQLLYGTGASPQIQGIMTEDGVQSFAWSTGVVGDTKIDAIRKGMTLAHIAEYVPSGVVVNPADWQDIQLAKGDDDHYIWASVASGTGQVFFLLPVVVTNAINADEALVGSFSMGSTLWDREEVSVRASDSHEDYFTKNLLALLAEERVCQTIHRPDSFVKVDFDVAPT